jgi:hypothetical protein
MKAEHRKELQTNALADRMGRLIQRARQGPSRAVVLTVLLVVVLLGALVFFLWRRSSALATDSSRWVDFDLGPYPKYSRQDGGQISHYQYLISEAPGTPQSRGAGVQEAWSHLYDAGIKLLLTRPLEAVRNIKEAKRLYEALLPEVKDDPVLGPEVRYNLAVAEESLAVEDPDSYLEKATKLYKAVVDEYPNSAHGKQAQARLKQLKDREQYHQILAFYAFELRPEYLRARLRFGDQAHLEEIFRKLQSEKQRKK